MSQDEVAVTTDSWSFGKILKHILFPKPKGSPKAGKIEISLRIGLAVVFGTFAWWMYYAEKTLPGCDQSATKNLVEQVVNDLPVAKAVNAKFVTVKNVSEQGFNKEANVRSCAAILVTTKGEDNFQYSVKWHDEKNGVIYVEGQVLGEQAADPVIKVVDISNQLASGALEQYAIAKRNGASPMDMCIQATTATMALLQAKDEAKYAEWKIIEKADCARAGVTK